MNAMMTTTLHYQRHALEAVHMAGQMWLRGGQIAPPLGYADERNLRLLYTRHEGEFTADETREVTLPTAGGTQAVRVFSLRGARLLALLARTPPAKAFRRWVLDLLEGKVRHQPAQASLALPGTYQLPADTVRALDEVASLLEPGHPALAALQDLRIGARPLPSDPALDHLAERFRGVRTMHGEVNKGYRAIAQEARRYGYSWEAVKLAARAE
jgi:prophage antirepressor-like protein